MERIKQVILIRKDLKMRRGKEIAQGSHASMEFLASQIRQRLNENANISIDLNADETAWLSKGMAKVCLQVNSEQDLLDYHESALRHGLKSFLITDSGRTEFAGTPTLTACAIGPAGASRIDAVTGELTLY
ncbi:MAG: aminoacyl-tRNA hydrolase [Thiogranum sp.]